MLQLLRSLPILERWFFLYGYICTPSQVREHFDDLRCEDGELWEMVDANRSQDEVADMVAEIAIRKAAQVSCDTCVCVLMWPFIPSSRKPHSFRLCIYAYMLVDFAMNEAAHALYCIVVPIKHCKGF